MADPFSNLSQQGVSTFGYGVLDAPDQRLREIALKAQDDQALTPAERRRLAQRQGVELQTARVARAATGFGGAGVPVSTVDYLAGTDLDPRMRQAAALAATRALDFEPVLRDVQLARAQQEAEAARFATSPEVLALRDAEVAVRTAEARAAARSAQPFSPGAALDTELAPAVEPAVQPAPVIARPAPPAQAAQPTTPYDQDRQRLVAAPLLERQRAARSQARAAATEMAQSGRPVSMGALAKMEAEAVEAASKIQTQKRKFTDPKTQHVFEYDADVDGLGNVVRLSEPTISSFNPVTQKLDTDFAVQNQEWVTGGRQRAESNIRKLYSALTNLEKTSFEASFQSGGFAGLPLIKSAVDVVLDLPKETERQVLSVAAESLREILGGQFAMKEGQQVLERAYDRYAKEGTNKQFVAALLDTIAETAAEKEAQAAYFRDNGTMAGYAPRSLVTNAGALEARIEERLEQARASAPQTPAQQEINAAKARAIEHARKYNASRKAAPAQ